MVKNYTTTIGKVLLEWLEEKGWDVSSLRLYLEDEVYEVSVAFVINRDQYLEKSGMVFFEFTQSDLEAAYNGAKRWYNPDAVLSDFIRAELERQCDE